jgi:putative endonuclease
MSWYVYLLECRGGQLYCGIAIDVDARFAAHREGRGARYTRANPPQRIAARFACRDRSEATRLEAAVKRLDPRRKRELCGEATSRSLAQLLGLQQDADDTA